MIASVVHVEMKANHQILSKWLKRATSAPCGDGDGVAALQSRGMRG
jgi:hypothetical protein